MKDKLYLYPTPKEISNSSAAIFPAWDKKSRLETLGTINLLSTYWTFPFAFNKCKNKSKASGQKAILFQL